MNSDSRLMDRATATTVTSASSANVTDAGTRFHSACAEKNVANRIAIADASSAFAVAGYRRAAFSSHVRRSAIATTIPIAARTGGWSQPCCTE
jgi:hypothetical protein